MPHSGPRAFACEFSGLNQFSQLNSPSMKFRTYLFSAIALLFTVGAVSGVVSPQLAFLSVFLTGAALTPVNRSLACGCPRPFDALRIATENLPMEVHQRSVWHSMWLNAIPRTEFPMNTGVAQTNFVIGNSEPSSNTETWTEITLTANVISTMCDSSYTDAEVGYNEYTYKPRRFGLRGVVICRETLGFAHDPVKFLGMYVDKLAHRAKRSLEYQFRNAYTAIADKAVLTQGNLNLTQGATTFPIVAATQQLTWDFLDEIAVTLMQAGATNPDGNMITWADDGPVFPLEIGIMAKQRLTTNIDNIRQDFRFADMGKGEQATLFQRLGATLTHKNFRFVPCLYPSRYTYTGGVGYTEVDTWEMVAGSEGTVARLTSAWKTAPYEAARVVNPHVMNARMVKPDSAGLDWNPINYSLEWTWLTGNQISETYCFDPFKDYGRHFARCIYAPEKVFADYGLTCIFRRCPNDITGAQCSYPY
jgi:hypothetical protein